MALGVSTTPVREALKRLEADGALVGRSKMAFFVNDPDQIDFAEVLDIRLSLEIQAIRTAAARATATELEPIRKILDEYEALLKSPDADEGIVLEINFRFHFEIYKMSGFPVLVQLIETLWLRIGPALHKSILRGKKAEIAAGHREMLEALATRDPDRAKSALRNDLISAGRVVIPQLRARPQAVA